MFEISTSHWAWPRHVVVPLAVLRHGVKDLRRKPLMYILLLAIYNYTVDVRNTFHNFNQLFRYSMVTHCMDVCSKKHLPCNLWHIEWFLSSREADAKCPYQAAPLVPSTSQYQSPGKLLECSSKLWHQKPKVLIFMVMMTVMCVASTPGT